MGTLNVMTPSLVARNITEVFVFLRNNAQQDRVTMKTFSNDDTASLITYDKERDSVTIGSNITPQWINIVDEINYELTRIKARKANLKAVQKVHTEELNFADDQTADQEKIKDLTDEITSMFTHCNRLIKLLEETSSDRHQTVNKLRKNVINSLLLTLNNNLSEVRTNQADYLRHLDSRVSDINNFLLVSTSDYHDVDLIPDKTGEEMTIDQIQQIMENEHMTKEREKEIIKISKSILELNSIFKDISTMILDQGTILDRIDYNVEQTSIRVRSAYKNVEKAERYQNNKKMQLIVILAGFALFLMLLILATKI